MKTLIALCLAVICQLGFASSAFASIEMAKTRPIYTAEAEKILNSNCKATAWLPYSGFVYYKCDNQENFWSYMMVNVPGSPLFMYNHRQQDDDDQASMDATVASSLYNK